MQEKWLPGNTMDRIRDLCRSRNITQVELAQAVGMDKSTLSRVMAEKTSKLSSKNLVAIANYFEVSTDFLLGLTDIPARKEHDIERLGLSVEAAANLHQGKLNCSVVCQLLENPKFAELTRQIALYQEGILASGVAAQNQMYNSMSNLMLEHGQANPEDMSAVRGAVQEAQALKRPVYADEIENITRNFRQILAEMKQDGPERVKQTAALTKQKLSEITKVLPRQKKGLQLRPEGIMGMLSAALNQITVPEEYQAELGEATDQLKQAIWNYMNTTYNIQMEMNAHHERNPLSDDSERKS